MTAVAKGGGGSREATPGTTGPGGRFGMDELMLVIGGTHAGQFFRLLVTGGRQKNLALSAARGVGAATIALGAPGSLVGSVD